jgi:hypothetical protein
MKKYFFIFGFVFLGLFTFNVSVFAAGGGGGGAGLVCQTSDYTCNDWSSCSPEGVQTRVCTQSFYCQAGINTKPPETQTCTPPQPIVVVPPPTKELPTTPEVPITPIIPVVPSCTSSIWSCGAWSKSCDISGQEHRSCHLVSDCAQFPTSSPPISQACEHLQCGNLATLEERITCRLTLTPAGIDRELKIQYLPEECRAITNNANERKDCIARYKSYKPCWTLPEGEGRFACASKALNLSASVPDAIQACQTNKNPTTCLSDLKEKVLYMIKFHFYDLEQRAEDLYYKGADPKDIASFDVIVETKKQEFDQAKSKDDYKRIILDVRLAWQDFMNKVKDQIK